MHCTPTRSYAPLWAPVLRTVDRTDESAVPKKEADFRVHFRYRLTIHGTKTNELYGTFAAFVSPIIPGTRIPLVLHSDDILFEFCPLGTTFVEYSCAMSYWADD